MILSAEHVRLIRAGRKTQHRIRVLEPRSRPAGEHPGFGNRPHIGPVPLSTRQRIDGKLVAVPQCTMLIVDYHQATLADLDITTARAEGHKTTDAYKTWWVREHDRPWINTYTLKHEIEPDDTILIERFENRHTLTPVWVLSCQPEPVTPERYIALDGRGDEHGYTTRPELSVRHIPPAVDEAMQRRISDQGREYDALRAAGAAEQDLDTLRDLDATIVRLRAMGVRNGVNLRDQVRMVQQTRTGVERKIRQQVDRRRQAAA